MMDAPLLFLWVMYFTVAIPVVLLTWLKKDDVGITEMVRGKQRQQQAHYASSVSSGYAERRTPPSPPPPPRSLKP